MCTCMYHTGWGWNVLYVKQHWSLDWCIDALHSRCHVMYQTFSFNQTLAQVWELSKVKSLQVAPAELEEVIQSHPQVAFAYSHDWWVGGGSPQSLLMLKFGDMLEKGVYDFVSSTDHLLCGWACMRLDPLLPCSAYMICTESQTTPHLSHCTCTTYPYVHQSGSAFLHLQHTRAHPLQTHQNAYMMLIMPSVVVGYQMSNQM